MVIIRPLINEKSMKLTEGSWYTFVVGADATKDMIARTVKEQFSVDPLAVRIINLTGKRKMQRTRKGYFTTLAIKKALVKIKKGQKIALFEVSKPVEDDEVTVVTGEGETQAKVKKSLLKGTKVKVERMIDKREEDRKEDHISPTKQSQKEAKKG